MVLFFYRRLCAWICVPSVAPADVRHLVVALLWVRSTSQQQSRRKKGRFGATGPLTAAVRSAMMEMIGKRGWRGVERRDNLKMAVSGMAQPAEPRADKHTT